MTNQNSKQRLGKVKHTDTSTNASQLVSGKKSLLNSVTVVVVCTIRSQVKVNVRETVIYI